MESVSNIGCQVSYATAFNLFALPELCKRALTGKEEEGVGRGW